MPCSAESHRVKIGLFSPILIRILRRKSEKIKVRSGNYSPFTTWNWYTDFTWRCVLITVCGVIFLSGVNCVQVAEQNGWYCENIVFMLGGCVKEGLCISSSVVMSVSVTDCTMDSCYGSFCNKDLLLRAGIESNPGPGQKSDSYRQTRLNSGANRRISVDTSAPTSPPAAAASTTETVSEPSLMDIMTKLTSMDSRLVDMDSKFNDVKTDMKELKDSYRKLHGDMEKVQQTVQSIKEDNDNLREENATLKSKLEQLELKTDDLECRSKRNNVILYGISRSENETPKECEEAVQKLITDKLDISGRVDFDRIHRINNKPNSPIVGRCTFFKDKVDILKARTKLKGSNIFISEDFSTRVQQIRKKLSGHLKTARDQGKRATMIYDHLLIDGKRYDLDRNDQLK